MHVEHWSQLFDGRVEYKTYDRTIVERALYYCKSIFTQKFFSNSIGTRNCPHHKTVHCVVQRVHFLHPWTTLMCFNHFMCLAQKNQRSNFEIIHRKIHFKWLVNKSESVIDGYWSKKHDSITRNICVYELIQLSCLLILSPNNMVVLKQKMEQKSWSKLRRNFIVLKFEMVN